LDQWTTRYGAWFKSCVELLGRWTDLFLGLNVYQWVDGYKHALHLVDSLSILYLYQEL